MDSEIFRKNNVFFEGYSILVLLLLLVIVIFSSITTASPLYLVIVAFSPAIFTVIVGMLLFEESFRHKISLWFSPIIILGLFFYVSTSQKILSSNLDISSLMAINVIIIILYLSVAFLLMRVLFYESSKRKEIVQIKQPKSIRDYVSSIEDKSKAINFVIGRVYKKNNGGSKELRKKILISPEWYNEFADIENADKEQRKIMISALSRIEQRLKLLNEQESIVLGPAIHKLKKIKRNATGGDRIIDVLIANDKDPVDKYYEGALEFCQELKKELSK